MRILVAAAACSGKTTLVRHLRTNYGVNAVDFDEEIARLNGGVWPDIPTKNAVIRPKVIEEIVAISGEREVDVVAEDILRIARELAQS